MKKFLLLCGLFAMAMVTTCAQETKRVAILEVVDKENKLTYSQKLVLRSNMARAVANTPGYEAYDRTDIDAILGEQDFQRTGLVSDSEIRKLGEMAGVSLILVTEGALTNDNKIIVSVKLLNVETARVEKADYEAMEQSTQDIQRGCKSLIIRLFGDTTIDNFNVIKKISANEYMINNQAKDRMAYEKFIQQNCPEAWKNHTKGQKAIIAGWSLFGIGLAVIAGGVGGSLGSRITTTYSEGDGFLQTTTDIAIASGVGGVLLTTSGIISFSVGYSMQKKAITIYNTTCIQKRQQISVNLKADPNGLGLALHF